MGSQAAAAADAVQSGNEVANLATLSFAKLKSRDAEEEARLFEACSKWGFFYLDVAETEAPGYMEAVDSLFDLSKEYFARPLDEKKRDTPEDFDTFNICGYKPLGLDTGNVKKQKDGCEGLRIPLDLHFNPDQNPNLQIPQGIKAQWPRFASYMSLSQSITSTILESLSDGLALTGESRLEAYHKPTRLSTTTAVLQCYPLEALPAGNSVGHFTHTDTGSLTLLFNTNWGLQVYSDEQKSWSYVEPRSNHAIVNVGDALRFLSGFRFKSCLHRVVPSQQRWTSGPRFATIFFLRPNNEAEFIDGEGVKWTAERWLNRKFSGYRTSHAEQKASAVSTGKKGFIGLWEGSPIPATREAVTSQM